MNAKHKQKEIRREYKDVQRMWRVNMEDWSLRDRKGGCKPMRRTGDTHRETTQPTLTFSLFSRCLKCPQTPSLRWVRFGEGFIFFLIPPRLINLIEMNQPLQKSLRHRDKFRNWKWPIWRKTFFKSLCEQSQEGRRCPSPCIYDLHRENTCSELLNNQ